MDRLPQNICPFCDTEVKVGVHGIQFLECKHWVHTKCFKQNQCNFEYCKEGCSGPAPSDSSSVRVLEEESNYQGHDYISNPKDPSWWTSTRQTFLGSEVARLLDAGPKKCPIAWLIKDKGYGLQHLLADGIDIEDFVTNGYTWQDLKQFKDMQTRPKEALYALHLNAEHLRDYPEALPVKDIGITGQELVELYGFYFPEDSDEAEVLNGRNIKRWTAKDLVQLGMTVRDLFGADMRTFEQYEALSPSDEDEAALGVKDEHINALPSIKEQQAKAEAAVAIATKASEQFGPQDDETTIIITKKSHQRTPRPPIVSSPATYVARPRLHGLRRGK